MSRYIGYWIMEIYPGRVSIPPSSSRSAKMQVQDSGDVNFLEHVQAHITLTALRRGDVQMYLTSPGGTKSQLLARRPHDTSRAGFQVFFSPHDISSRISGILSPHDTSKPWFQVYFPPHDISSWIPVILSPHATSRPIFQVYFSFHDASRSGYQVYFSPHDTSRAGY